jgi:hypothetical protein
MKQELTTSKQIVEAEQIKRECIERLKHLLQQYEQKQQQPQQPQSQIINKSIL